MRMVWSYADEIGIHSWDNDFVKKIRIGYHTTRKPLVVHCRAADGKR